MNIPETCLFDDITELNRECYCLPMERPKIEKMIVDLDQAGSSQPSMQSLLSQRQHYFANTGVFLSQVDMDKIQKQITAIETTITVKGFQQEIFMRSHNSTFEVQPETKGVFMGYDFHISPNGPRLIEINSNAGGAFIVDALNRTVDGINAGTKNETEIKIVNMFQKEWALAGRTMPLKTVAIIDESPRTQFHYPDMRLAVSMFKRQGIKAVIVDPQELSMQDGKLMFGNDVIDLVYNRLTDFTLNAPDNRILRLALEQDIAAITPAPRHHALYADKQNLALLTDPKKLSAFGVNVDTVKTLSAIPKTVRVTPENMQELWANRRQYFFKPNAGFGSRAAYKGAKLTKKVWSHITAGGYIAQKFIAPPIRAVVSGVDKLELKYDLRVYTYGGQPLLLAARVYQGQTTNLRTQGGGLAPVII